MYDKYQLSRCDAMEWLAEHYPVFPASMPDVPQNCSGISYPLYKRWRFVYLDNGVLAFADCLSPCIRAEDMEDFRLPEVNI